MSKRGSDDIAGDKTKPKALSPEDVDTDRFKILTPSEIKARDLYQRDVSGPRDALTTTAKLRALSSQIRAKRGDAELKPEDDNARSKLKK